ncbi:hypothetical protein [Actinocorallia longicatena]|uniref:Uncharacterized protein n=1 Tax=Actinocorallia longicatena TaxID=111803 RepID=A0ABP6QDA1_9ACTN
MTLTAPARRQATGSRQIFLVLASAFTLSVTHTVYAWASGLESPDFTVRSPLTWLFYGVAFAMTALSPDARRWARWTVQIFLAVMLLISVFVYPQTFEPHQQTVFGWFENDVYVGLLILAAYLSTLRLRQVDVVN